MSAPNIEGVSTLSTYSGGGAGVTLSNTITDPAGMHGFSVAQSTGYGTATGAVKTTNFPGASANILVTAETLSSLINDLVAKGIIGE